MSRIRRKRMEQRIDRRFNALIESLGEDGRDKMIRAADRFLELAEQKALIAKKMALTRLPTLKKNPEYRCKNLADQIQIEIQCQVNN